jgi:calcineurin-like phosphoesterase family protein
MNTIYFSSDYHFYHKNIIKYENRPFQDVDEMNETIINRHNERVKESDIIYFLGDWGFYASTQRAFRGEGMPYLITELRKKMNGNFICVEGNHDKSSNKLNIPNHRIIIKKGGIYINLVHRSQDTVIEDDIHYYPLTICGHHHGKFKTKEISKNKKYALVINVSVENNNYYPYSFNEIMSIYWRWLNTHPNKKQITNLIQTKHNKKVSNE